MQREGYLIIDHQASPGLPEDVARASGLDPRLCGEGKVFEAATLTCSHCKASVVKNPLRQRERPYCPKCNHYICDFCEAQRLMPGYTHTPFEKIIDTTLTLAERGVVLGSPANLIFPT